MTCSAVAEYMPVSTKPSSRSSEEMRIILFPMVAGLRSLSLYSQQVDNSIG
jgi:hypothetical protein